MKEASERALQSSPLLRDLLRDVSRSFYLTLRVLPESIREPIGLAYLLARATDTIADTGAVRVEERLEALRCLQSRIVAPAAAPFALPELHAHQSSRAEKVLLERIGEAIALLFQVAPGDRERIQRVVQIITEGQALDLERFGRATRDEPAALQSAEELHDYTYRVAGCVGEFWTRMCVHHLRPSPRKPLDELLKNGIRFGKGLQLVNILRDLPADLRNGRCYLPWPALQLVNLQPGDLLDPGNEPVFRPVYDEWLGIAHEHLRAGWLYVLDLPWQWVRVRLACAWPILIGRKTLDLLRTGAVLNPDTRIKVSRRDMRGMIAKSVICYPFPRLWRQLGPLGQTRAANEAPSGKS